MKLVKRFVHTCYTMLGQYQSSLLPNCRTFPSSCLMVPSPLKTLPNEGIEAWMNTLRPPESFFCCHWLIKTLPPLFLPRSVQSDDGGQNQTETFCIKWWELIQALDRRETSWGRLLHEAAFVHKRTQENMVERRGWRRIPEVSWKDIWELKEAGTNVASFFKWFQHFSLQIGANYPKVESRDCDPRAYIWEVGPIHTRSSLSDLQVILHICLAGSIRAGQKEVNFCILPFLY